MAYDKNVFEALTDYKTVMVVPGARRRRLNPQGWKVGGIGCTPEDFCVRQCDAPHTCEPGMDFNKCKGSDLAYPGPCDPHGERFVGVRRFKFKSSSTTVLFANLHGALYNCGESHVTDNQKAWAKAIGMNMTNACTDNAEPGDAIILTGDFNCNHDSTEMEWILSQFTVAAQGVGGINQYDHVFVRKSENTQTYVNVTGFVSEDGRPSDHNILVAHIGVHGVSDQAKYKWV